MENQEKIDFLWEKLVDVEQFIQEIPALFVKKKNINVEDDFVPITEAYKTFRNNKIYLSQKSAKAVESAFDVIQLELNKFIDIVKEGVSIPVSDVDARNRVSSRATNQLNFALKSYNDKLDEIAFSLQDERKSDYDIKSKETQKETQITYNISNSPISLIGDGSNNLNIVGIERNKYYDLFPTYFFSTLLDSINENNKNIKEIKRCLKELEIESRKRPINERNIKKIKQSLIEIAPEIKEGFRNLSKGVPASVMGTAIFEFIKILAS